MEITGIKESVVTCSKCNSKNSTNEASKSDLLIVNNKWTKALYTEVQKAFPYYTSDTYYVVKCKEVLKAEKILDPIFRNQTMSVGFEVEIEFGMITFEGLVYVDTTNKDSILKSEVNFIGTLQDRENVKSKEINITI